jgi:hypothetical protein
VLGSGGFIEATVHGRLQSCVTPRSSLLSTEFGGYAEGDSGQRLLLAPVHVCPGIFVKHPDTMEAMVKRRARPAPETTLGGEGPVHARAHHDVGQSSA